VARDATPEAIHSAYRQLAKRCHPDLFPGEITATARFIALTVANNVLSHADQRGRFDRTLARKMADRPASTGPAAPARPRARPHLHLTAEFLDAVNGATIWMTLPDGARREVTIPPGTTDGDVLHLQLRGFTSRARADAADSRIEIHVTPHWQFMRQGQDISLDVAVTQAEVLFGRIIEIATPRGAVHLHIPPGSANGTKLRLNRQGVPTHHGQAAGDLLATLRVVLGTGGPSARRG
jgi:DnaJ-class molecular chaperone